MIGPNAPQDVKDAWMEAAKEVNAHGMGIKTNGMLSHISQMMVQRLNTVSYTHLDVYKRQKQYITILKKIFSRDMKGCLML